MFLFALALGLFASSIATAQALAPDGVTASVPIDHDGDGVVDADDPDDDNDGLPDDAELRNDGVLDHDHDGTPDGLDRDDDDDAIPTREERPGDRDQDHDNDGTPDHLDADDDNDGLPTSAERLAGLSVDSDNDGLADHIDADDGREATALALAPAAPVAPRLAARVVPLPAVPSTPHRDGNPALAFASVALGATLLRRGRRAAA